MNYLYLVADGARARLFQTDRSDGELEETEVFVNAKGRLQNRDFGTDQPGRSFKGGGGRSSMGEDEPREHEEKKFAKRLADHLNKTFKEGKFDRLGIVAAPKALGRIKSELNAEVKDVILGTSSKNLTRQSRSEIRKHIAKNVL